MVSRGEGKTDGSDPVSVFVCYAREDADQKKELDKHLRLLEREGLIHAWSDGEIRAGSRWGKEILDALETADRASFRYNRTRDGRGHSFGFRVVWRAAPGQ